MYFFGICFILPILFYLYLIQSKRRRNRGGLKPSCAQKNTCSVRMSVYSRPRYVARFIAIIHK